MKAVDAGSRTLAGEREKEERKPVDTGRVRHERLMRLREMWEKRFGV